MLTDFLLWPFSCVLRVLKVLVSVTDPMMDFSLSYFTKAWKLSCPRLVSRQYTSWTSGSSESSVC